jgi:multidrug efflux pump subunit AcrB
MANPLNGVAGRLATSFQRLSERERRLVVVCGAALVVFFVGGGSFLASSAFDAREKRVVAKQQQLDQILSLRERYQEAEQNEKRAASRVKSNNVSLFSLLQKTAGDLSLQLNDLNERKVPVKDTELVEVSVDVTLKEISIDKLNSFLEKIEGPRRDGIVKVQKLKVKTRFDQPDMLEVSMTVSTWKPAGGAAATAEKVE